VVDVFATFI
jgi:hypothetical protein